jgi:hypothetical protein
MFLILLVLGLMVISTVLVVAAGMLSSRLSRQEGRVESFNPVDSTEPEISPQSID